MKLFAGKATMLVLLCVAVLSGCKVVKRNFYIEIIKPASALHNDHSYSDADAIAKLEEVIRERIAAQGIDFWEFEVYNESNNRLRVEISEKYPIDLVTDLLSNPGENIEFYETIPFEEGFSVLGQINTLMKPYAKTDTTSSDTAGTDSISERHNFEKENPLLAYFLFVKESELIANPNSPVMGYVSADDTSEVSWWLREFADLQKQHNLKFMWSNESEKGSDFFPLIALRYNWQTQKPPFKLVVKEATTEDDPYSPSMKTVNLTFSQESAKDWAFMTGKNIDRNIAICFGGKVLNWPIVKSPIAGGKAMISGLERQQAEAISRRIMLAPLPFAVKIVKP